MVEVTERQAGPAVVVGVTGRLVVDQRLCPFCERIDALLDSGARQFVIDLKGISYMDSAGVGALVWKYRSVTGRGGTFKLLQPSPRVRTLLHITRLDTIFDIYESEAAAIGTPGQPSVPVLGRHPGRSPAA